uniref:E3 ubiquitin-protein ligase TRIM32 n=1 Tax=Oryzias latipes TaxID=8090 RepID=A0A3P9L2S0_ORYLA
MFGEGPRQSSSPISIPAKSPDCQLDSYTPSLSPQFSSCWVTQAQCDLAQVCAELQQIQEHHKNEFEAVKRSVERAVLGVHREERRLLERVEQDHRDTQQHLEQVQRENLAAVRVSQTLMDQRFRKLAELQCRIEEMGQSVVNETVQNNNLLIKEITEFLQPWEMTVSLKKVNFKPSSQTNAVTFGEIHIQDQNLSLNVGSCGPHGQPCALHSQEIKCEDMNHQSFKKENSTQGQGWTSPTSRVVRKISLSNQSDLESEDEQKLSSAKILHWLPKCEQSDRISPQHTEMDSGYFQQQGEDLSLAVPVGHKHIDTSSADEDLVNKINCDKKSPSHWNQKKLLSVASNRKLSPSPERRKDHGKLNQSLSLESQDRPKRKGSQGSNGRLHSFANSALKSPGTNTKDTLTSQSCLELTCRGRLHSRISQSSDEHSLGTLGDSGRAPSPADSLDSSYTFIIGPSYDYGLKRSSLNYSCYLSKSALDLTQRTHPLIPGRTNEQGLWKVKNGNSTLASPTLSRRSRIYERGQNILCSAHGGYNKEPHNESILGEAKQPFVARSLSLSAIDVSSQELKRDRGGRELALAELEEEGDLSFKAYNPSGFHFIGQFGKQGSGRADLTLPSGIHATPQGHLFIVDCGNARVQVTDPRGNVLQQLTSARSDGSTRRCRNYFDIAVNGKGLIALSCAAERALLVFNRHGRLLQTFGGSGLGSAKDELEAPRGVTATRLDDFLVADIRKGTLISLKLEPKTGSRLERTVVTGFHRPYLVATCLTTGLVAVSERGNETGRVPCIKVLEPGWSTIRVLGVCAGMGPVLVCPWGICIDTDGNVLVADWGEQHKIVLYPEQGMGWPIVNEGLSSPRGLTLLPEGQLAVSDSMHHCIKIFQYK